tara:strand:+ start:113 stop:685 length:573 start_codon:yes stop_codon:yes gene_type:complete
MKITKKQLRRIIKEEALRLINEEGYDYHRDAYRHDAVGGGTSWENERDRGWADGSSGKDPDPNLSASELYMDMWEMGREDWEASNKSKPSLNEYGGRVTETGSYLVGFAQAYASLGAAIQEQLNEVINVYMIGGGMVNELDDVIHQQNPAALETAIRKLRNPVQEMSGFQDAEDLLSLFEEIEERLRNVQ